MKRFNLIDRVEFMARLRAELFTAAREASKVFQYESDRQRAEIRLEQASVNYGSASIRYLGGHRP